MCVCVCMYVCTPLTETCILCVSCMSLFIILTVNEVKEEVADGWKPKLVLAYVWPQSNQLLCAFESSPKANVLWYLDGKLLNTTNDHYTFTDESAHHLTFTMATLLINNPTESDYSTGYQCVGENSLGQTPSRLLAFQQFSRKRSASANEDSAFSLKTLCSPDSGMHTYGRQKVLLGFGTDRYRCSCQ